MNVNFFGWIRDGVKQSVLMGVSDAIEIIGSPVDTSTMHPNIAALAERQAASQLLGAAQGPTVANRAPGSSTRGRKRLGRSLKDINPTSPPSTDAPRS